jgi:hypothetical protein
MQFVEVGVGRKRVHASVGIGIGRIDTRQLDSLDLVEASTINRAYYDSIEFLSFSFHRCSSSSVVSV